MIEKNSPFQMKNHLLPYQQEYGHEILKNTHGTKGTKGTKGQSEK